MQFTKKPVTIEAVQYTRLNIDEIANFVGVDHLRLGEVTSEGTQLQILTLEDGANGEAKHVASPGDWIIKGVKGEFYPCKPDIFQATYEAERTPEQIAAAEEKAAELRGADDAEAEDGDLAQTATMLDTYAKECFPANDEGQVHFARALMESAATAIRVSLAQKPAAGAAPVPRLSPVGPEDVDAESFAARTAHVAAGELYGLMMTENAVPLDDWHGSVAGDLEADVARLAGFITAHKIDNPETLWRYGLGEHLIRREADRFENLSFARRQAFTVFAKVCSQTFLAIKAVQDAAEKALALGAAAAAQPPLKLEDSIFEEQEPFGKLVDHGEAFLQRQQEAQTAPGDAAAAMGSGSGQSTAKQLFGGKGDHDGDGRPGGSKPPQDPPPTPAPMSVGERPLQPPKPNAGGRPKRPAGAKTAK